jgi:predicted transcriptional regulator
MAEESSASTQATPAGAQKPRPDLIIHLSRRERQILGVLYRHGTANSAEIRCRLPEPPTYSTVRALLRTLERKGFVTHEERCLRYVFLPTVPCEEVSLVMLKEVVVTFFGGSPDRAMQALIGLQSDLRSNTLLATPDSGEVS